MRNVRQRRKKRIRTIPFSQEWWERYGLRAAMICGGVMLWGMSSSLWQMTIKDSQAPSTRRADMVLFEEPAPPAREAEYIALYEHPPYPQAAGSGYGQPDRVNAGAYAPHSLPSGAGSIEAPRSVFGEPMPPPDDIL